MNEEILYLSKVINYVPHPPLFNRESHTLGEPIASRRTKITQGRPLFPEEHERSCQRQDWDSSVLNSSPSCTYMTLSQVTSQGFSIFVFERSTFAQAVTEFLPGLMYQTAELT
jgi:hypothetical protein